MNNNPNDDYKPEESFVAIESSQLKNWSIN